MSIKTCIICNKTENEVNFAKYKKKCNKCNSRLSNQKILESNPAYFRTKMRENYKPRLRKVGRPKKIIE
jgi:uncharacterized CHY-type Zn-finger protein